ncbi:MAG: hypothetical protein E7484_02470 [Ruminococcaceae bacterium]|nr:hypothetical protein [Oscillospiraceae bacterium]
MEHFSFQFTKKFTKNLAVSIFFVVYFIIFWFLFFNKGIYLDGHFYKKSATLTQITYSASSLGADFDRIVLEKYMDKSLITIDDKYMVSVFSSGSFDTVVSADREIENISADWPAIASQKAERIRGFGNKPWYAVALVYILFFLAKRYNVQLYSFFRKGRAAGEKYYRYFDAAFTVFCIAALIYLIIPF